ncbi:MAG: nucleoside deaminase [Bacteroidales bacterium]|jgi:tRNA(adenine34) deaminase|nr:nucleoside deaminase [Bacteroidales bacterium]
MFTDEYFMRKALNEAHKACEKDEVPVGAVIVADNRIIARAYNLTETLNDVTAHAEMQAITIAASYLGGKYLKECTLYVTLEPCLMCAGALYWAQITRIVYGATDTKRGFSLNPSSPLHPASTVTSGILETECAALLTNFFRKKRRL